MTRPRCGNDPRAQLTDGDRQAVADFKAYLADRAALRDRIADALAEADGWVFAPGFKEGSPTYQGFLRQADAVLAVLPEPAPTTDAEAVECSAQNRNYESGPRLCIRAAQHRGDHIDKRGFHWPDTTAVYPVSDGTFRRGTDVRTVLRRMADETQDAQAHPPHHRWRVETLDYLANEWAPGTGWPTREQAVERYDMMKEKAPAWKDGTPVTRRLVRETTTHTVEAVHQPAAGARQDGAES